MCISFSFLLLVIPAVGFNQLFDLDSTSVSIEYFVDPFLVRSQRNKNVNIVITSLCLALEAMGGGGHGHTTPAVPDWRIYKVEDAPQLVRVRTALAQKGLKDPWLRNEVWRYHPSFGKSPRHRLGTFIFRGFKYGVAAFLVTIGVEKILEKTGSGEGHGHGH